MTHLIPFAIDEISGQTGLSQHDLIGLARHMTEEQLRDTQ